MPSVQDKYRILGDDTVTNYLTSGYSAMMSGDNWWWLEPMPTLSLANTGRRLEFARRMSGIHGDGDPVWGASIIHMAEQASGTPFSIEGPESAVNRSMEFMFSPPGGYREAIKQTCYNWVVADPGAAVEIIWTEPRKIRDGVFYRPMPAGMDIFDPAHLRLVAPQNMAYPYAYKTNSLVRNNPPAGWEKIFRANEIPLSRQSVARIVNLPMTNEELFGCGVSPSAIALKEWQIAMGNLNLLLQDATNTSAYTVLFGQGVTESQMIDAMQNRQTRIKENHTHALASALMIFANEDALADGDNGPMIQGLPLRRYPENWDWRMWLEERIQIYATILGISPMSIIMSIYARANQAGAQYAADEAGVRRTSLMVGLSDIFANHISRFGATFQYRSHRLADRDREFTVFETATKAWKMMYEANINGVPLLGATPEEAAQRARVMMAEQRVIKPDFADGEASVAWDHETDGSNMQVGSAGKSLVFLGAAMRNEQYVVVDIDPSQESTRVTRTVVGRCALRTPGRPATWNGWSAKSLQRWAPVKEAALQLKAAAQKRRGAMVALYPSPEDAQAMALQFAEGGIPWQSLHLTLAYIKDRDALPVSRSQVAHLVQVLAGKTGVLPVTVSGIGRFGQINSDGMQPLYASIDSEDVRDLHEKMSDALEAVGIEQENTHGFQPHITLAYLPANAQTPNLQIEPREITMTQIGLAWGGDAEKTWNLQPPVETKEGEGGTPRGAPRRQRVLQEAWEGELATAVKKLRRTLQRLEPTAPTGEPDEQGPTISDRDLNKLQGYVDRWENALGNMEASVPVDQIEDKIRAARRYIETIQGEIDSKTNQRLLLALLAIFIFSDEVQRQGAAAIAEGMGLAGMSSENFLLTGELQRLGVYVQGSLTPDLVGDYLQGGQVISGRLERRMMIFYGGALWSAMQLAVLQTAPQGTRMRVDGPNDEHTCSESDPGGGVACASIVGREYVVGVDSIPVLGRDTKCGQACRHWWTVIAA